MFLTVEQLQELTGTPRRTRQIHWLVKNGWKFAVDIRGRPVVAEAEVNRQLAGGESVGVESPIRWQNVA